MALQTSCLQSNYALKYNEFQLISSFLFLSDYFACYLSVVVIYIAQVISLKQFAKLIKEMIKLLCAKSFC